MKRLLFLVAPPLMLFFAFRPVSSTTISGKITDGKGIPLASVTVIERGTSTSVSSANNGTYKIMVANNNGTLVFSGIGYQTKEVKIKGRTTINVSLTPVQNALSEVIIANGIDPLISTENNKSLISDQFFKNNPSLPYSISGKSSGLIANNNQGYFNNNYNSVTGDFNTESYDQITENRFLKVKDNPLSTFSIDVDPGSYSNVRRFLNLGQLPPAGAVRIEEMINYFHYEYPQPDNGDPFSINTEISDCPWNKENKLVLIGLQGKKISTENLPASNFVFLIDVSGSMDEPNKLPLVKASMKILADQLRGKDRVAIVVYAGKAGLVLPSTSGDEKIKIKDAIDGLEAGGSTNGGEGIKLAYKIAKENFKKGGNNRIILCTDGDFNVGPSSDDDMESLVEAQRNSGVFLTVMGFGMGNYKDSKMERIADKGNGNHAYIDGLSEAKKFLINEFGGSLFTIAKDVKLQVEFNPAKVQGYRLIGYENRMLNKEDFNNDKKDAGELGSDHTVTALYEVVPAGVKSEFLENVDPLKYQSNVVPLSRSSHSDEIMTVKFRYKAPDGDVSKLIEHPVIDKQISIAKTSDNFRFAASVAEFGMLLRNSEFKLASTFSGVLELARKAKGKDEEGYRSEFIRLVENAQLLAKEEDKIDNDKAVTGN